MCLCAIFPPLFYNHNRHHPYPLRLLQYFFSEDLHITHIFCRTYYLLYFKKKTQGLISLFWTATFLTMADTEQRFPSHRGLFSFFFLSFAYHIIHSFPIFHLWCFKRQKLNGFDAFHFIWVIKEVQGWKLRDGQRVIGIYDSSCSFVFCKAFLLILKADHSVKSIAEKKNTQKSLLLYSINIITLWCAIIL